MIMLIRRIAAVPTRKGFKGLTKKPLRITVFKKNFRTTQNF